MPAATSLEGPGEGIGLSVAKEPAGATGDPALLEWVEFLRPPPPHQGDVLGQLRRDLGSFPEAALPAGSRVGVAVGSRGIADVADVVGAVVAHLKDRGRGR